MNTLTKENKKWLREFFNNNRSHFVKIWFLPKRKTRFKDRFGNIYLMALDSRYPASILCILKSRYYYNGVIIRTVDITTFNRTINEILHIAPQTRRLIAIKNIFNDKLGQEKYLKPYTEIAQDFFSTNQDIFKRFDVYYNLHDRTCFYMQYRFIDIFNGNYRITVDPYEPSGVLFAADVESVIETYVCEVLERSTDFLLFLERVKNSVPHLLRFRNLKKVLS